MSWTASGIEYVTQEDMFLPTAGASFFFKYLVDMPAGQLWLALLIWLRNASHAGTKVKYCMDRRTHKPVPDLKIPMLRSTWSYTAQF